DVARTPRTGLQLGEKPAALDARTNSTAKVDAAPASHPQPPPQPDAEPALQRLEHLACLVILEIGVGTERPPLDFAQPSHPRPLQPRFLNCALLRRLRGPSCLPRSCPWVVERPRSVAANATPDFVCLAGRTAALIFQAGGTISRRPLLRLPGLLAQGRILSGPSLPRRGRFHQSTMV